MIGLSIRRSLKNVTKYQVKNDISCLRELSAFNFSSAAHTFKVKLREQPQFEDLEIRPAKLKPKPPKDHKYIFGQLPTDYMFEVDSKDGKWGKPLIHQYHNFDMSPQSMCLHYALQCFEGLKAYPSIHKGSVNLFRPQLNAQRLLKSSERLALPSFDPGQLLKCLKKLVSLDKDWMPQKEGHTIYIRPTHIATDPVLRVMTPTQSKLFIILSPVGPYYPRGFKPVRLFASQKHVRAWKGGSGHFKLGSNYAPTIGISKRFEEKGFDQVLWTRDGYIGEVGTSNLFFLWKRKDGKTELITPELDGTILPGITRRSILVGRSLKSQEIARQQGQVEVTERLIKIEEVLEACDEGRMLESFGAGTAAIVSPIYQFHYEGTDYDIPINTEKNAGDFTLKMLQSLNAVYSGAVESDWTVKVD